MTNEVLWFDSNGDLLKSDGLSMERVSFRRRDRAPDCVLCDRLITEGTTFAPPHDASYGCESGKHSHCSCDTCF